MQRRGARTLHQPLQRCVERRDGDGSVQHREHAEPEPPPRQPALFVGHAHEQFGPDGGLTDAALREALAAQVAALAGAATTDLADAA